MFKSYSTTFYRKSFLEKVDVETSLIVIMLDMSAGSTDRAKRTRARAGLNDLVWEVSTYIEAIGENALRDTPLTLAAGGMLCLVHDEPGITIAEISRRVPKSAQALGQVASRLRKLGLIERRLSDGPGVGLYVTDTGREMADVAVARERDLTERLYELLGSRRYDLLCELLADSRDILKQLGRPGGESAPHLAMPP